MSAAIRQAGQRQFPGELPGKNLAPPGGLEPPTCGLEVRCWQAIYQVL
jgi:hypothetical protein